jgi:hypothetical protein
MTAIQRPTTFLGVDPAFRKNGFGVCAIDTTDRTARFLRFRDAIQFYDWIRSEDAPDPATTVVCIENSNLQDRTFARHQGGTIAMQLSRSRDVGKNQAVSELCVVAAKAVYSRVVQLSPQRKGLAWDRKKFALYVASDGVSLPGGYEPTLDEIVAYQLASIASKQWAALLR